MFEYKVVSGNKNNSKYIIDLLKIYGLCYDWVACESPAFNDEIAIQINTAEGLKIFRLVISDVFPEMADDELYSVKAIQKGWYSLRYAENNTPFPVWDNCIYSITAKNDKCVFFCFVGNNCIGVFFDQYKDFFLAANLLKYLEQSLFGIPALNEKEDWCEINGYMKSHDHKNCAFVDELLLLIRTILMKYSPNAVPVFIDFYPAGKRAPLLITGDSDESTESEILDYFTLLDGSKCTSCLLCIDTCLINNLSKLSISDKHCFGIHPFSKNMNFTDLNNNMNILHKRLSEFYGKYICTRNHLFQNTDARSQIQAERKLEIIFDMNSVLANGKTWIGTGNGTGIPIPFPPIGSLYSLRPLSLTTVIEDDVFLFDYDYCYKPYVDDIFSSEKLILSFLDDWVLRRRKTAQVNLHPQNKNDILRLIIDWVISNNVWNPSLLEYYMWIEERNGILIHINSDGSYYFLPENDRICVVKGAGIYESI